MVKCAINIVETQSLFCDKYAIDQNAIIRVSGFSKFKTSQDADPFFYKLKRLYKYCHWSLNILPLLY